ncbi:MAG: benzoyl-CoA reductase, bzd-type, subunit N [Desulfobacterales bacterium]|jgi:benzoyl-CoA reductase subunit C|nr:benzoyl-CoA reductase, bzd-type, subunit N [Desulfobacterales bacterium]
MIEEFQQVYENRHEYARKWKERTGGKVMGYLCTYVPEEVLYAANVLPVRLLGDHTPQSVTEPHLFAMYCPFCRDVLAQGLKGKYDYLDGIVIAQSCLHIRQTFSSWREHRPTEFSYLIPMPNAVQSKSAAKFYKEEVIKFKDAVQAWVGKEITEDDLTRGVEIVNGNRKLMKAVYNLRKAECPPMTGTESMYMVVASQLMDKEAHNQIVSELLERELYDRLQQRNTGKRLMVLGSENDDFKFMNMVESVGSTIVIDDHCTGSRYFWDEVPPGSDLLKAIADRYIARTPCPSKDWPLRKRFDRILEFTKDYHVDGAIIVQQKFCDPHETDKVALLDMFAQNNIPTLCLEFDVTVPLGPMRIRVDAFLETLAGEDLF